MSTVAILSSIDTIKNFEVSTLKSLGTSTTDIQVLSGISV